MLDEFIIEKLDEELDLNNVKQWRNVYFFHDGKSAMGNYTEPTEELARFRGNQLFCNPLPIATFNNGTYSRAKIDISHFIPMPVIA